MQIPDDDTDVSAVLNGREVGFNKHIGLVFTKATPAVVEAEIEVGEHLQQPYGLVHGGVYCSMVETLASVGAALHGLRNGLGAVGLENSTSFLKACRSGRIRGRATPLSRGRRAQVWSVDIRDDDDRLLAQGKVRMLMLPQDAQVAGEQVAVKDAHQPKLPD